MMTRLCGILVGVCSIALLVSCVEVDPGESNGGGGPDAISGPDVTGADTAEGDTSGTDTRDASDGGADSNDGGDVGDEVCPDRWADDDNDGHPCRYDNCPDTKNVDQNDGDGDGVGDKCDNCPDIGNADQKDTDSTDGTGDACTVESDPGADRDGDGTANAQDNCPETKNPMQSDGDRDARGDECDNCPAVANTNQKDGNDDGTGDACTDDTPDVERGQNDDSDGDGISDQEENGLGTDPNNPDTDGDGVIDGAEVIADSDPASSDKACGQEKHTAKLEEKPIDILFAIDTSGSMSEEISAVERNINQNFANIIRNSGLDFRVIMLANASEVCIGGPLGSNSGCDADSPPEFYHIDTYDGSRSEEVLRTFEDYFNGHNGSRDYQQWLRQDAFKILVGITDEEQDEGQGFSTDQAGAQTFDNQLTSLSNTQFGTPMDRNYLVHGIIGISQKANSQDAYQANEPVVGTECDSAFEPAPAVEWISKMTGGLRYPVCNTNSYDAVFQEIAQGIVRRSRIQCELSVPSVPSGQFEDLDSVSLQWKPNENATPELLTQVDSQSQCSPGHFYVENSTIHLCPDDCNTINDAEQGDLTVLTGCQPCENPTKEVCDEKDNDCDGEVDEGCEDLCTPERETCDGEDNDCDGDVDEGCPQCAFEGASCSSDADCCNDNCRDDGTCGPPCRPSETACTDNGQCCSGNCAQAGEEIGQCIGG